MFTNQIKPNSKPPASTPKPKTQNTTKFVLYQTQTSRNFRKRKTQNRQTKNLQTPKITSFRKSTKFHNTKTQKFIKTPKNPTKHKNPENSINYRKFTQNT